MRTFSFVDPDEQGQPVTITMTEQEILDTYFSWWSTEMQKLGRADQISKEACIEDWVVVKWAGEVK